MIFTKLPNFLYSYPKKGRIQIYTPSYYSKYSNLYKMTVYQTTSVIWFFSKPHTHNYLRQLHQIKSNIFFHTKLILNIKCTSKDICTRYYTVTSVPSRHNIIELLELIPKKQENIKDILELTQVLTLIPNTNAISQMIETFTPKVYRGNMYPNALTE